MGSKPGGLPSCFATFQQQTFNLGGDKQDRTADLLHAMQALSQLSYTPANHLQLVTLHQLIPSHGSEIKSRYEHRFITAFSKMAEWTGLEPATPGVTGRYSNQLNYHSW